MCPMYVRLLVRNDAVVSYPTTVLYLWTDSLQSAVAPIVNGGIVGTSFNRRAEEPFRAVS